MFVPDNENLYYRKMKWGEFKRYAERLGWSLVRHGKEHDIYGHPTIQGFIQIERHWSKEIKPGLLTKLQKRVRGK